MREPSYFTREEYALTKVALAREEVPAEAFALLSAWIEGKRLLVDGREDVGGINFCRMDAKVMAPLPHIVASFFARRPYKRRTGHYPSVNSGIALEQLWWYFGARSFPPLTENSIQRVDISYGASIRPIEKLAIDLCHQGLLGPKTLIRCQFAREAASHPKCCCSTLPPGTRACELLLGGRLAFCRSNSLLFVVVIKEWNISSSYPNKRS